ncbi:MAG: amino acid permease [Acidobacteriota bacterium]
MAKNEVAFAPQEKLSRELGVFSVTMIGVGGMIGAGIFVLTGMAAGAAGPALTLAFILNGVVTIFTAMTYAELGSCFHDAGGGYLWTKEALPQPNGFISGWMSWFAHMVACSLYSLGFGAYFGHMLSEMKVSLFGLQGVALAKVLAVIAIVIFAYINIRGTKETGLAANLVASVKVVLLLVFIVFGLSKIAGEPVSLKNFVPFMPMGWSGVFIAMGLTFIAYQGYEIIAQCSEEVKNPRKNIPRAIFWAIVIVVPIYILIAFVSIAGIEAEGMSTWQFLGLKKEIAVVEAARHFMPYGGFIILVGGLFSTLSALNATIYSSSRVSFAMGRDRALPQALGRVSEKRRTPQWAIFISSIFIAIMAVSLPIEDVASACNIMFLLLFLLVNISLINLRRNRPELDRGFVMPWFPIMPLLGISSQMFLAVYMFNFSRIAWYVGAAWIISGIVFYYLYASKREKEFKASLIVYAEKELAPKGYNIMVALDKPEEVGPLMTIANAIAEARKANITLLGVVELPEQTPISQGKSFVEEKKRLLQTADKQAKAPVNSLIRVAHHIPEAIVDTVKDNEIDLTILGWKGYSQTRYRLMGTVLDSVVKYAPSDIAVLRLREIKELKSIFLPTAGGPHARFAAEIASFIARNTQATLTAGIVIDPALSPEQREKQLEWLDKTFEDVNLGEVKLEKKAIEASSVLVGIIQESSKHDLVIIGSSNEPIWRRLFFGTIPKIVAKQSPTSVMMVKKYEGAILSWFKKFLAG